MLNNEFPPLGGGMGTVNQALLECFARVPGLEIDLVTSAIGRRFEVERFANFIRIFKVPVNNRNLHHSSNRELITYALRAFTLALRLHRLAVYDLCFAWSAVPAGGVALALRRIAGLKYLVRVCGPDIPGFEARYRRLYPLLTPAIRLIWHAAETVVVKCADEASMVRAVDPQVKISIIQNGVDGAAFETGASILDGGPLRLLCVARLIERKGQRYLIEAVRRLVDEGIDVQLELVGTGDDLQADQALVNRLGLSGRVHFAGYVPRDQIAGHYASAHVFVLPSFNEGMSVATLEAMAAGLPIVTTANGGMAELVQEGLNGFRSGWGDVEALTAHLRSLALDRARLREMGAASRLLSVQFSWASAADRYLELFKTFTLETGPDYSLEPVTKETA